MAADAADRERQAQALAAAGMQAEQINVGGLQPPPVLGNPGAVPPSSGGAAGPGAWNNLDGGGVGGGGIMEADEMELDFAAMFDPAQEAQGEFFFRFLCKVESGGSKAPPLRIVLESRLTSRLQLSSSPQKCSRRGAGGR